MTARDRKTGTLAFLLQKMIETMDYRTAREVRELVMCRDLLSETGYYVCPRCHSLLDREFMRYCDRCGQRLGWHFYLQARVRRKTEKACIEILPEDTLR